MRQIDIFKNEKLSESEEEAVNEALYYAVRENLNCKLDNSKTEKMRQALHIMKSVDNKVITSHMCNIALDDFFTSCVARGWKEELEEVEWLKVS